MSKSDIQIAREAKMKPIVEVLDKINVPDEPQAFSPMGRHIAKLNLEYLETIKDKKIKYFYKNEFKSLFFNKIRHSPRTVKDFKQTKTTKLKTNLDSKIWFMLNLENASMGKLKKIPTRWFVKMLKDTRDIETTSPERLIKGREVLIEKLLSRVGSFDHIIVEGVSIKSMLRPNEAEFYGNF